MAPSTAPSAAGTTSVNGDKPPVAVPPAAVAGAAAATAGAAAADKARPSNSFEKIMLRLSTMYPNFTRYCNLMMKYSPFSHNVITCDVHRINFTFFMFTLILWS